MKTDPHILQRLPLMRHVGWAVSTKLRACTSFACARVRVCVRACANGTRVCCRICLKQGQFDYVCFNSWTKHIWCNIHENGGNHNMELREFWSPGAIMMANAVCSGNASSLWWVSSPCASPCGTHFANPSSGPTQNHQPSMLGSK